MVLEQRIQLTSNLYIIFIRDCNEEIEHFEKRIDNFKENVPKDP